VYYSASILYPNYQNREYYESTVGRGEVQVPHGASGEHIVNNKDSVSEHQASQQGLVGLAAQDPAKSTYPYSGLQN
jgi:hypothetical protein